MVKKLFRDAVIRLGAVTDTPQFEAQVIFESVLGRDYLLREIKGELADITQSETDKIQKTVESRLKGVPLQYLAGSWDFYGETFKVGPGALIPRQDTETLVDAALALIKGLRRPKAVDLCTGTGCVAISIKKVRPDAEVVGIELYPKAYEIFCDNAALHPGVTAVQGDAFSADLAEKYEELDLITANPPYLTASDMENLQREVRYEPVSALYGGPDGLDFYRLLPKIWRSALKKGGYMAVEIGAGQEKSVWECFIAAGFGKIETVRDMTGKTRVITAQRIDD